MGERQQKEDVELIREVARGSREALGALYDRHADLLVQIAQFVVHGESDAEDVVHDAFLEVWQRAGDYDPRRGSVRAWLRVRVRSRAIDRARAGGRRRALARDRRGEALESYVLAAGEPSLSPALRSLPAEQAEILGLGYGAGLSSTEIARELGVPVGTIKSRMAAGLRKLRECLRDGERAIEPAKR